MQWRSSVGLVKAAVRVDPFKGQIQDQAFPYIALNQLSLHRPLFGCFRISKSLGECADEHETARVSGIVARIKPGDQTAIRVADKHVRPHHASGTQQGAQIGDRIARRGWLQHWVASHRPAFLDDHKHIPE